MIKKANRAKDGVRQMKFGSFDGDDHSEHNDVDLGEIFEIFVTEGEFSSEMEPCDRVYEEENE